MDATEVTIALGTIVVFGVGAQWLGRRTGIPSIVLLLLGGIIAGPVTGLVDPEALLGDTLDPAVTLAVGLLLFDSGFSLKFRDLPTGRAVTYRLVTIGALITLTVGALAAYFIFDLPGGVAVLLGAVLVVSGPTVVGPILEAARPKVPTGTILEWEGTMLDPIGAALGIAVLTMVTADESLPILDATGLLLVTAATGVAIGLACAALLIVSIRYFAIPDDLQVPVAFMFAVLAFAAANVIFSEAGLFATLTLGLTLANQRRAYVANIRSFQASIGTLVIATLFVVLAATINLADLRSVLARSALLLAALVLVARPLAAFVSTLGSTLSVADRGFVASVAPRGIVAASTVSFFAISLKEEGINADEIVPITFAVIIGAGIVYGFGAPWMARILGVGRGTPKGIAFFMSQEAAEPVAAELADAGVSVLVVDDDARDEAPDEDVSYWVYADGVQSEGLRSALQDADTGTAVIGTGLSERDLIATALVGTEIGARNVYFLPRMARGTETGVDALWRDQTPDTHIAFGPDVTRDRLHDLLHGDGVVEWLPLGTDERAVPDGTIPLFVVTEDGRGVVANEKSIDKARRGRRATEGAKLLCVRPKP